jgi:hypothetical protein
MSFNAFKSEEKPMATIQRSFNRRAPMSSKFYDGKEEACGTGRRPYDIRARWDEPIPPFHEQFKLHHDGELTEEAPSSTKDHDNG